MRYLLFHKPFEVMPSFTDSGGRRTLKDFIEVPNVYAAGRLDYDSEGLLLLTNDGEINHRLTDPKFDHPKTYCVQVEGDATEAQVVQLRRGVVLKGETTKPTEAAIIPPPNLPPRAVRNYHPTTWLKLTLREGKKRQVRRMTAAVGLPCLRLVRVGLGPLELGALPAGQWRELTQTELLALRKMLRISF
jgi:23S rRNA pseudouridine2457 synthase